MEPFYPNIKPLILISNGLPKSGSTLSHFYNIFLLNERFGAYATFAREAIFEATREKRLKGVWNFVEDIREDELKVLSEIAVKEGPVLVKTHCSSNQALTEAIRTGLVRMTYTIRDPRDVVLSLVDHCHHSRSTEAPLFQEFTSVMESLDNKALESLKSYLRVSIDWVESGLPHIIRYADQITDPTGVISNVMRYLGVRSDERIIKAVIEKEFSTREVGKRRFNQGKPTRFRSEMTAEEFELSNHLLKEYIERLGYDL
jgi:hypothetical protein